MTITEVEQLDDNDLCYVASHHLYSLLPPTRTTKADLEELLLGPRMFLATDMVEMEVSNGGFHQCYFNFGDEYIPFAIDGFRCIGANACADIVSATWQIYKQARSHFDAIHQEVEAQQNWQAFADSYGSTELDRYDTPFYEAKEREELEVLQATYIRQHLQTEFSFLLTPPADNILQQWRERNSQCRQSFQ